LHKWEDDNSDIYSSPIFNLSAGVLGIFKKWLDFFVPSHGINNKIPQICLPFRKITHYLIRKICDCTCVSISNLDEDADVESESYFKKFIHNNDNAIVSK